MAESEGASDFFSQHYLRPKKNQTVIKTKTSIKTRRLYSNALLGELFEVETVARSESLIMAAKHDPERCEGIPKTLYLFFDDDYEEMPVASIHWSYVRNNRQFPPHWDYQLDLSENQGIMSTVMAGYPSARIGKFAAVPEEEIILLSRRKGMRMYRQNGQRIFGPPKGYDGPEPLKGSEVFIGKLPRDLFEPEVIPVCEKVGKIYELRMMMDFSGTNRGYCFVRFFTPEDANRAVAELNDYEIRKGRKIGVLISVDNCRLFLGGIPRAKTEEEIFDEMSSITEGVRRVICYPSAEDKTKNRGFAFIEYDSHRDAALARRMLFLRMIPIFDEYLQCDWAEPLPNVTKLYVRNLSLATTEEELIKRFNECSDNGVERVKKIKNFAFVHFASREQAEKARYTLDRTDIDGCLMDIEWAKPPEDTYKAKKALSRQPRPNYQREPVGFPRGLFNGY